jgi:hypothetical protein
MVPVELPVSLNIRELIKEQQIVDQKKWHQRSPRRAPGIVAGQHEIGTHHHQRPESQAGGNQTQDRMARNERRIRIDDDDPEDAHRQ